MQHLKAYSDSQLIIDHMHDEYEARKENIKKYLWNVKDLIRPFWSFDSQQIPRVENVHADSLGRLATYAPLDLHAQVFFKVVEEPGIKESALVLSSMSSPIGSIHWFVISKMEPSLLIRGKLKS